MTAIAGASAGVKDLADGSLRITIEFEPKDAKNAFELFGTRGTPVALAALKTGYAAVPAEPEPERVKVGPLCREAVELCKVPEFQRWMHGRSDYEGESHEGSAKNALLGFCQIDSRKELDTNPAAASRFVNQIRIPFMKYMKFRSRAAASAIAGY